MAESNAQVAARIEYDRAYKQGQREYNNLVSRQERGNLLVLDELTEQSRIMAYIKQPEREIPLKRVVGTYTSSRAYSFSASFLPLHPTGTEFASKWISLCASHMNEGLRDAIQVYEYLWNYYVVEGNKRVSVLKHFGAPSIRAEITRLIPQLDNDDPLAQTYYAFLQYDREGLFKNLPMSSAEKYNQLLELEKKQLASRDPSVPLPNFNSMLIRFEEIYASTEGKLPVGDALLEYAKLFGLLADDLPSVMEERIKALLPQLRLTESPPAEPQLMLDVSNEKPQQPSLLERLFIPRKTPQVMFAYEQGRTETNWIGAHERGRLIMQEIMGEHVKSDFIDNLTPENAYAQLSKNAAKADLLLVTSTKLSPAALRFSLEHPDCLVLVYSRVRQDYRLNTYYGRYYEPVFLCGVAAALATKTDKVAYVTPYIEHNRHTPDINAFALGARSVRPTVEVLLVWKDVDRYNPATCENGIRLAVEHGADIGLVPDYPGLNLPNVPVDAFTLLLRMNKEGAPSQYLASPGWDWGRFYTEIVKSYLNGSLDMLCQIDQGDPTVTGLWWGMGAGVLRFASTDFLPASAHNLLQYLRKSIELGRFNPFRGPVYDQAGDLRIPPHTDPKPHEVLNMSWIADFIRII